MYQALYRKYRSKTFDELVGQDSIRESLKNQIKRGDISHAYIFSGTRGTGKTSAAKIFAKAVNCLNMKDGEPCNECENCKAISEDRALDVVEMDAASNNGVDDIRELKEKAVYPPQNLKYKVYIIDEVHMLSKGAFNALLKILEEPPSHLIFILATTELEKIPATILSRTQKFNFKRIDKGIIFNNLKRISRLENRSCDDEVLKLIASNSDGAMRDALSILDQLFSLNEEHITYDLAIESLGISSDGLLFSLTEALINRNTKDAIAYMNQVYSSGKDIMILVSDLISKFRDLMILKVIESPEDLVDLREPKKYKDLADKTSLDFIIETIKILNESLVNIKYAQDKRVLFEMSLIKITVSDQVNDLSKRLEAIEEKLSANSFLENKKPQDHKNLKEKANESSDIQTILNDKREEKNIKDDLKPEEVSGEGSTSTNFNVENEDDYLNIDEIKSNWNKILLEIRKRDRINVVILLSAGRPVDFNNNTLIIEYESSDKFKYTAISDKDNVGFIEDFLGNYYNRKISIRFKLADNKDLEESIEKLENLFGKENINRI